MLLQITTKCNEGCTHCMVNALPKGAMMTDETFESSLKVMQEFDVHILNISGGDPFYHPKIFDWIHRIRKETNVEIITVESNGWYFLKDTVANKELIARIHNELENELSINYLQICSNKKYYPNFDKIAKLKNYIEYNLGKSCHVVLDDWQILMYGGRAKDFMTEDMITRKPQCLVFYSQIISVLQLADTESFTDTAWLQMVILAYELNGKSCDPFIRTNGDVILGESADCKVWFNVNDYVSTKHTLRDTLLKWVPCNRCKGCKNLTSQQIDILNNARNQLGLQSINYKNL